MGIELPDNVIPGTKKEQMEQVGLDYWIGSLDFRWFPPIVSRAKKKKN